MSIASKIGNVYLYTGGLLIIYLLAMLYDEYLGTLLAVIVGSVCLAVWAISHVVEWIEPSRVPSLYYSVLLSGWLAPGLALMIFIGLRGEVGWLS